MTASGAAKTPPSATRRCRWAGSVSPEYIAYHDREWGVPVRDDRVLFEFLVLEGAQAGLSWATILRKRERYREVFAEFDPGRVARFTERKRAALLEHEELEQHAIVTNRHAPLEVVVGDVLGRDRPRPAAANAAVG